MVSFVKRHRVIILSALLCLFSLHIASTNIKGVGGAVITTRLISFITSPIQNGTTHTIGTIKEIWRSYIYLVNVNKENKQLRGSVAELVEENNRLKEATLLNSRLKEMLAFKQEFTPTAIAADIIGIENMGWVRTATINKGLSDGIRRDMAVVTPLGIVGRIIDVQPASSKVLLITDPRCSIDVIVRRNRVKGIAEGTGTNRLALKYVNQTDDIRIGDTLISAGLGGIFPKGMVLGEIVNVEKGDDNFFMDIELKPGADLKKLEEVLVITEAVNLISP